MAEKWADYGIHAVRYDSEETHIEEVGVKKDKGDSFGKSKIWTRQEVLDSISDGGTFITIVKDEKAGKWDAGAIVDVVRVNGKKYLRTDPDKTEADNLGELPTF